MIKRISSTRMTVGGKTNLNRSVVIMNAWKRPNCTNWCEFLRIRFFKGNMGVWKKNWRICKLRISISKKAVSESFSAYAQHSICKKSCINVWFQNFTAIKLHSLTTRNQNLFAENSSTCTLTPAFNLNQNWRLSVAKEQIKILLCKLVGCTLNCISNSSQG